MTCWNWVNELYSDYIVIWWKICFKIEEKRKQSKKFLSENFDLMSVLIPGGTSMSLGGGLLYGCGSKKGFQLSLSEHVKKRTSHN